MVLGLSTSRLSPNHVAATKSHEDSGGSVEPLFTGEARSDRSEGDLHQTGECPPMEIWYSEPIRKGVTFGHTGWKKN